jgi:hypothetical protein
MRKVPGSTRRSERTTPRSSFTPTVSRPHTTHRTRTAASGFRALPVAAAREVDRSPRVEELRGAGEVEIADMVEFLSAWIRPTPIV